MFKIILEGYSKDSMEAALANAMGKAASYMSESKDVNVQVLELTFLPGRGYKAVIELTVVPMGEGDVFKPKPEDVQRKQEYEKEFKKRAKEEEEHLKHMITDHFADTVREYLPPIPDYLTQDMNEIRLLNYEIERAFLKAAETFTNNLRANEALEPRVKTKQEPDLKTNGLQKPQTGSKPQPSETKPEPESEPEPPKTAPTKNRRPEGRDLEPE